jgi:hypothetical protein
MKTGDGNALRDSKVVLAAVKQRAHRNIVIRAKTPSRSGWVLKASAISCDP